MSKTWKHDELMNDLADHLRRPDRMMWQDMQLGPSGSARPDIYTMAKSYAHPKPMVYEIKISVSDYRSDITSGKWQKYLDFACGVYFAVPSGLITKQDLPKGCGLIVRGGAGWRTLKAPTLQKIETLPQQMLLKMLIDGINRNDMDRRRESFARYFAAKAIAKKFGEDVGLAISNLSEARQEADSVDWRTKHIIQQAEQRADRIMDQAKQDAERIKRDSQVLNNELYQLLGVDPDAKFHQLAAALESLKKRTSVSQKVRACENVIASLRRSLMYAEDTFPVSEND